MVSVRWQALLLQALHAWLILHSLQYINFNLLTGIEYILCNKGQLSVLILDLLPSISASSVKYSVSSIEDQCLPKSSISTAPM